MLVLSGSGCTIIRSGWASSGCWFFPDCGFRQMREAAERDAQQSGREPKPQIPPTRAWAAMYQQALRALRPRDHAAQVSAITFQPRRKRRSVQLVINLMRHFAH